MQFVAQRNKRLHVTCGIGVLSKPLYSRTRIWVHLRGQSYTYLDYQQSVARCSGRRALSHQDEGGFLTCSCRTPPKGTTLSRTCCREFLPLKTTSIRAFSIVRVTMSATIASSFFLLTVSQQDSPFTTAEVYKWAPLPFTDRAPLSTCAVCNGMGIASADIAQTLKLA